MAYILCSTLHDPEGGLLYAVERLPTLPVDKWYIWATDKTSPNTLDRLSGNRLIELRVKKPEDRVKNVDPIESDHVNAIKGGCGLASQGDAIHYVDADRLLMAATFFQGDLEEAIRLTREAFDSGNGYVSHVRTREAMDSHTTPMKLTEPIVIAAYRQLLETGADPLSTSHAFSYPIVRDIIENPEYPGQMSYPHGKWLLKAVRRFAKEHRQDLLTGMCFAYETAFAIHKRILAKLNEAGTRGEIMENYDSLSRAFEESGVREETEFGEWPSRIQIAREWLEFLLVNSSLDEGKTTRTQSALETLRGIDIETLKSLNTRDKRESYCRHFLEGI